LSDWRPTFHYRFGGVDLGWKSSSKVVKNFTPYGGGFLAALDQSGGNTPTALAAYGVDEKY
jgi:hypothetical protein